MGLKCPIDQRKCTGCAKLGGEIVCGVISFELLRLQDYCSEGAGGRSAAFGPIGV
jgi:hypothetical protein